MHMYSAHSHTLVLSEVLLNNQDQSSHGYCTMGLNFIFAFAAMMTKLKDLLHRSENRICADCSAPDPKWA